MCTFHSHIGISARFKHSSEGVSTQMIGNSKASLKCTTLARILKWKSKRSCIYARMPLCPGFSNQKPGLGMAIVFRSKAMVQGGGSVGCQIPSPASGYQLGETDSMPYGLVSHEKIFITVKSSKCHLSTLEQ